MNGIELVLSVGLVHNSHTCVYLGWFMDTLEIELGTGKFSSRRFSKDLG